MVKGDRKKAEQMLEDYYDRQTQYGNNSYYLRQALTQFAEFELWEAAEKFAVKHRSDRFDSTYDQQEFDRTIATGYARNGHFTAVVEGVLKKESFKGRDLELLKAIAKELQGTSEGGERRAFVERLVAADPKNRELAWQLAEIYDNPGDASRRMQIIKRLLDEDPNSSTYRNAYTKALMDSGKMDEALAGYVQWANAKPSESRFNALATQQKNAGRLKEARATMEKAIQLADSSRKADARLQLADFDTEHGDRDARKNGLRERFEKKKDASSFQTLLGYLESSGLPDEAYALFQAHKDAGYLDRYQGDSMYRVCIERGDFQTPLDMNWQFSRYGERYYGDNYFSRVAKIFEERGKAPLLAADVQARIAAETNRNVNIQERLARAWADAGFPDKALAYYDEKIKQSPFNRTAANAKAALLVKLHRDDEAVALLRETTGVTSLQEEIQQAIQLATTLFQTKRPADAEKELNALLSWAKGGDTFEKVGNLYFDQKEWTKAAAHYEQSMKLARSWNFDYTLTRLGQCYAKLGRGEEATKIWDSRPTSRGVGTGTSMMDWLLREGLYEGAVHYIEARMDKKNDATDPRRYIGLAEAYCGLGKTNEAFEALARGGDAVPGGSRRADFNRRTGALFVSHQLTAEAAERYAKDKEPWLAAPLVSAIVITSSNGTSGELLAKRIE